MGAARALIILSIAQATMLAVKQTRVPIEVIAMLLLCVSLFSMKWTSAACTIARSLFCRCRTSLVAAAEMDGTMYTGDLRGWYEGRAYFLRDGVYEARVTGGMQPIFPPLFSLYMFFKRVLGEWILFSGAVVVLASAGVSRLVLLFSSWRKGDDHNDNEKDEYAKSFDDIKALGVRKKGYGRRFLAPRRITSP
ncbi:hypothetical protein FGB62_37g125 [Gracilaria domingensis]|nr:hypothetical protein FGB62_37g125 [Gracilaria domingensis]